MTATPRIGRTTIAMMRSVDSYDAAIARVPTVLSDKDKESRMSVSCVRRKDSGS